MIVIFNSQGNKIQSGARNHSKNGAIPKSHMSRETTISFMKKLLLGSVFLTFFAISITLFQASCQKEVVANTETAYTLPPATTTTLGGVIVGQGLEVTTDGTIGIASGNVAQQNKIFFIKSFNVPNTDGYSEIWSANYDGSNQQKFNIVLPSGMNVEDLSISPDKQSLFITCFYYLTGSTSEAKFCIFSCKPDGSNLKKIIENDGLSSVVAF